MASVHDVAAYILEKEGPMSTMKLQKLTYYCQGWSLAWDERPLFAARIEAWANGPVVPSLYSHHRGQFMIASWPNGDSSLLSQDERDTIDAVLEGYGDLSGQQLGQQTHEERPWLEARGDLSPGARSNAIISEDAMQDFFGGLAAQHH